MKLSIDCDKFVETPRELSSSLEWGTTLPETIYLLAGLKRAKFSRLQNWSEIKDMAQ